MSRQINNPLLTGDGNDILTEEAVSAMLGVRDLTLRRWRQELGLPYRKVANRIILYRRSELDEWIDQYRPKKRS